MKQTTIFLITFFILAITVSASGDLIVELQEPQHIERTGFSEKYFLPFKITNIGDEPVTSRFPIKNINEGAREGVGYPLYIYSGEMMTEGVEPLKKAPIEKADGTTSWQTIGNVEIPLGDGIIPEAPSITLQPGESLLFNDYELIGSMTSFNFQNTGTYTIGYEIDPIDDTNEILEENDNNNKATIDLEVVVETYVKGPNEKIGIDDNQYWFFFKELGDCLTLELPETTEICQVSAGAFTTTLTVNGEEVKLYHIFEIFGFSKEIDNLEFVAGDGYIVTYT